VGREEGLERLAETLRLLESQDDCDLWRWLAADPPAVRMDGPHDKGLHVVAVCRESDHRMLAFGPFDYLTDARDFAHAVNLRAGHVSHAQAMRVWEPNHCRAIDWGLGNIQARDE
jgi:hypothetical protein